jgi:predicted metal-dependent peptidase
MTDVPGIAAARLWAATRFPYLASGVFGMTLISDPGSGTVGVDDNWRMHIDPDLTVWWTPSQVGSVIVHLVSHLLRTHGERAQAMGVGPDDTARWLRAADAEINDDLVPAGLDLPRTPLLPRDLGAPDGLLAEQYYQQGNTTDSSDLPLNCGSGAHGQPHTCGCENGQCHGGLPRWQAELLRRQIAQEVLNHSKLAGNMPAGLLRWAEELLTPKVDWRRLLAALLRRAVSEVAGAVDYSYRRPSRRSSVAGGVVLPALRRPVPEVAVVCDTSGSMTDELLAMALTEVDGLLKSLGLSRQLRVLSCDTAVDTVQRVTSTRQITLTGGGGTNMGAGIDAAAALRPRPAICVVLTDGITPWPASPPKGMRVIVALLGEADVEPPAWASMVRVPANLPSDLVR